jgi:MSHA pilin protein MshD
MFNKRGFTLLEMILFIVVFSLGIVGVMTLYINTLGKTSDPILRNNAVQVLQSVMEVVYNKKWDENTPNGGCDNITTECSALSSSIGPDSGETSLNDYDDIDDFVNSGSAYKKSRDWLSQDFGLISGFNIKITISYARITGNKVYENTSSKSNYKLIQIEVQSNGLNESYKLIAVKANF